MLKCITGGHYVPVYCFKMTQGRFKNYPMPAFWAVQVFSHGWLSKLCDVMLTVSGQLRTGAAAPEMAV